MWSFSSFFAMFLKGLCRIKRWSGCFVRKVKEKKNKKKAKKIMTIIEILEKFWKKSPE